MCKYLYFTGMQQLEKKEIIREVSHELDEYKIMEYNYETDLEIGQKYDVWLNDKLLTSSMPRQRFWLTEHAYQ